MLVYTSDVANAINRYEMTFGKRIKYREIPSKYQTEVHFVSDVDHAIETKNPIFGGEYKKRRR